MAGIIELYNEKMGEAIAAVQNALAGPIRDGLEAEIAKYAEQNVYSYEGSPYFMQKRRYSLDNKASYVVTINELSITIDGSEINLQNGVGGEVDIVESGDGWGQPYPRPYMDEALQNYIASGEADRALAEALQGMGFTATVH